MMLVWAAHSASIQFKRRNNMFGFKFISKKDIEEKDLMIRSLEQSAKELADIVMSNNELLLQSTEIAKKYNMVSSMFLDTRIESIDKAIEFLDEVLPALNGDVYLAQAIQIGLFASRGDDLSREDLQQLYLAKAMEYGCISA